MFFCTLNDLVQQRHASISKKGEEVNNTTVNKHFDYLTLAKFALATVIGVNALVLIALYMVHPVRGTGLFKDFSQSAFSIMLAFALVQPLIKDKIIATPITLIFFLGFFITFSRTANFLLFIYLVALFVIEYRNNRSRHFLKIIALIGLSYLLVQIYPLTIDQTTVNRGFSDITTLNSRTSYWSAAWQAIIQSPLTGYGFHTYEFTGVKTLLPYRKITNIHNDYLQVWHDLGALWLLFFIAVITTAAIKFCPLSFSLSPRARVQIKQTSDKKQIAWVLLMCMFAYMLINFILLSTLFQVVFVLIITELLKNEPA